MGRLLLRMLTAIQLTRLTMAFGAVSDVWFVILFTRRQERYSTLPVSQMDLWLVLLAGAVVAVGLFAYAASLNDVLDARHDSAFSPDRPIPAGRIRPSQAVVVAVGALLIAVLAAGALGLEALRLTLLVAAGILFYDTTGKHIPAIGIIVVGLIHASHMFIPNFELAFTLPVVLIFTHTMAIAMLVHVFEDKRPRFSQRAMVATILGWAGWSGLLISLGILRDGLWPRDWATSNLLIPGMALAAFVAVAWWKASASASERAAAERLKRYGAIWQSLYAAAWLFAAGLGTESLAMLLFGVLGFGTMTAIKEITGVSGQPITFRG